MSPPVPYAPAEEVAICLCITHAFLELRPIYDHLNNSLWGDLHFALSLNECFRQRLPPVISNFTVQKIIQLVKDALEATDPKLGVRGHLGAVVILGGYEELHTMVRQAFDRLMLNRMRDIAPYFVERVGREVPPKDRLQKLLVRLKNYTTAKTALPKMKDLRPLLPAPIHRDLKFIADGTASRQDFLQAVLDHKLLKDVEGADAAGSEPSCFLEDIGHAPWTHILGRRAVTMALTGALHAFASNLVLSALDDGPVDLEVHDHDRVKDAVEKLFRPLVEVLKDALRWYQEEGLVDAPERKVFVEIQDNMTHASFEADAKPARAPGSENSPDRRRGRTTIPKVLSAKSKSTGSPTATTTGTATTCLSK
ncbi:hypothetical protein C8R46DRAFT_1230011 [Mycena filopes]|nr:hypothetical protein C8R46DRAFT_1230011 [Mycena filopes]